MILFYKCYLLWLIQKELNDIVSALGVVEEDKERPMNEPCPLLERLERGGDRLDKDRNTGRGEDRKESVEEAQTKNKEMKICSESHKSCPKMWPSNKHSKFLSSQVSTCGQ